MSQRNEACAVISDCWLATCDGCQYDSAQVPIRNPKIGRHMTPSPGRTGLVYAPGLCPSCRHTQHVGAVCGFEINTYVEAQERGCPGNVTLPVRCSCPPEKAIKADEGKASGWSLLAWDVIPEVLGVYAYGIKKGYLKDSWRNVDPERYEDALMRHVVAHVAGERLDPESGLRHIAHAAWNCLSIMALRK